MWEKCKKLNQKQIYELGNLINQSQSSGKEVRRAQAVLLLDQEEDLALIGRVTKYSRRQIFDLRKKYILQGLKSILDQRIKKAKELLGLVGLADRIEYLPNQLSGGQQQRVAIARSLANNPAIILADEPTGNLATVQAEEIMDIFKKLYQKGHTIVMITHEHDIAQNAKRIITLRDGKIVSDKKH